MAKKELAALNGEVESYVVPQETVDELEAAADEANVEEVDETVLEDEGAGTAEVAVVAAAATGEAADDEDSKSGDPKQAVIHYHRHDARYDGWGLHVWTGYEMEVTWEKPIPPTGMDDFGIYFALPITEGAVELAYIIHKGDEKDLADDQLLDFATDGYEVWIIQNTPGYVPAPASGTDEESSVSEQVGEGETVSEEDDA